MALEANEELDQIDPKGWHDPEVLKLRLDVSRHLHSWELMKIAASNLAQVDPADPQWSMSLAYATHRVESFESAKAVLLDAEKRHAGVAYIHFNLACYETQRGNLSEARERLARALAILPSLRQIAFGDPDLEPLWQSL